MKNNTPIRQTVMIAALLCMPLLLFAQERSVTLEEFISLVETNSLELESARTDRSLAAVQERLTRSQLYPNVGGQIGYTRNLLDIEQAVPVAANGNVQIQPGIYPLVYQDVDVNTDNQLSLGFSLSQKLFDMSVFRGLEASEQYTTLTDTAFEATRQGLVTEAKRLFYRALLLGEVLAVRRSSEELAYRNYLQVQNRFNNGVASRMEVLRAEVNWKITRPATTQAERNHQLVLQNLKNLAGLPNDMDVTLVGGLDDYPELPAAVTLGEATDNRPDFQILLSERKLREINIDAKRATFFPSLSATASYGMQAGSDEFDFSDPTDTLTFGLNLTIPVFYGGSRFAQMEQARLELRKTHTQISQKEEDIFTELENIRLTLREASQRIESAEQTVATAEEAYAVTQSSVTSGLATQLELEDARVSLEQARLSNVSAVFDYLSAYFDWQRATGHGADLP